jgi:hypothetical protein
MSIQFHLKMPCMSCMVYKKQKEKISPLDLIQGLPLCGIAHRHK